MDPLRVTVAPTGAPTGSQPHKSSTNVSPVPPVTVSSKAPTVAPLSESSPTSPDSLSQGAKQPITTNPTDNELPRKVTQLRGLKLTLRKATILEDNETEKWEESMEDWFNDFYDSETICQRRLLRSAGPIRITTEIELIRQDITYDDDKIPSLTITYDQWFYHEAKAIRKLSTCVSSPSETGLVNLSDLTPEEMASLPFEDNEANSELVELFQNFAGLQDVEGPFPTPTIPENHLEGDKGGLKTAVIAVIVIVPTILLIIVGYVALSWYRQRTKPALESGGMQASGFGS